MDRDLRHITEAYEAGYELVPCDGKAGLGRWNLRSYTLDEILWHVRRGKNVAVKMGGTRQGTARPFPFVWDRDSRSMASFRFLQRHNYRSPMEIETAAGNWHVYGQLPADLHDVRTRIRVLGLPVDLKVSGLCVFAGSVVGNQPYRLRKNKYVVPPAELPVFDVREFLQEKRTEPCRKPTLVGAEVERVRRYVAHIVARCHSGAHNSAYRCACKVALAVDDFGRAMELFREWNARNAVAADGTTPFPFDERALEHKMTDAFRLKAAGKLR